MKFTPGNLYATPAALRAISKAEQDPYAFVLRHCNGDHGELAEKDNEDSLKCGLRVLSIYKTRLGQPIWVVTESDKSSTTVSVPEDFGKAA